MGVAGSSNSRQPQQQQRRVQQQGGPNPGNTNPPRAALQAGSRPAAQAGYPGSQPRTNMTNYPANMRQPLNPNLFPTANPAPIPTQFSMNSVAPRDNLKEGVKLVQLATVDAKSVVFDLDSYLLTFTVTSNGPCSYEVHTGIRERIDPSGKLLYTPNRLKKAPVAYLIDKALPEGEEMLSLLADEVPQMNPAELVYNPRYPKYYPCVIVLRWKDEGGKEMSEHTFINLGLRPQPTNGGEPAPKKTGKEAPGYVHKQLLEANGSVYTVESLFGADDDIVVGAVAGDDNKDANGAENSGSPAEGNVKPVVDDDDDNGLCVICISEPKDTCVIPCRHLCLCKDCAIELQKHTPKCPVCREPIQQLLHLKG